MMRTVVLKVRPDSLGFQTTILEVQPNVLVVRTTVVGILLDTTVRPSVYWYKQLILEVRQNVMRVLVPVLKAKICTNGVECCFGVWLYTKCGPRDIAAG